MAAVHAHVLPPVESTRIVAVLSESISKLSFLNTVTPDVLAHRDELSALVGDEVRRVMQDQHVLEKRYERLLAARGRMKGMANKKEYLAIQEEINGLSAALRESTKNLCRNLKDNPNIGENLLKIQKEREQLEDLLAITVRELREGRFDTLVAQVQEEKAAQDELASIVDRERKTCAEVQRLVEALKAEKDVHAKEMAEKEGRIRALKEELKRLKVDTAVKSVCAAKEAHARTSAVARAYAQEETRIASRLDTLLRKKAMEEMVHTEMSTFLGRQTEALSAAATEWTDKHVRDCEAKDEEIKALKEERERDLEVLRTLQERCDRELAADAARRADECRQKELERLRAEDAERRRVAATHLQRGLVKLWLERKKADAGKKGKKKAGGAKAKGKKKK